MESSVSSFTFSTRLITPIWIELEWWGSEFPKNYFYFLFLIYKEQHEKRKWTFSLLLRNSAVCLTSHHDLFYKSRRENESSRKKILQRVSVKFDLINSENLFMRYRYCQNFAGICVFRTKQTKEIKIHHKPHFMYILYILMKENMKSLIIFSLKKTNFQSLSFIQKRFPTKHIMTPTSFFEIYQISKEHGTRRPQNNNQNNFTKIW